MTDAERETLAEHQHENDSTRIALRMAAAENNLEALRLRVGQLEATIRAMSAAARDARAHDGGLCGEES
jgi:multidrug resistance efflux pump